MSWSVIFVSSCSGRNIVGYSATGDSRFPIYHFDDHITLASPADHHWEFPFHSSKDVVRCFVVVHSVHNTRDGDDLNARSGYLERSIETLAWDLVDYLAVDVI